MYNLLDVNKKNKHRLRKTFKIESMCPLDMFTRTYIRALMLGY